MAQRPVVVDEASTSEFCREMKAALERRLAAASRGEKLAREREIIEILRKYRGRNAWTALADAERVTADVSRDTTRDLSGHAPPRTRKAKVRGRRGRRYSADFDYKRAQAGDESED